MEKEINKLLDAIVKDFEQFNDNMCRRNYEEPSDWVKDNIAQFKEELVVKEGRKYIKIMARRSVWGFVVNTDDDKKFKRGDLLMAASLNTPARNHARGNIFGEYQIQWTGPNYIVR